MERACRIRGSHAGTPGSPVSPASPGVLAECRTQDVDLAASSGV